MEPSDANFVDIKRCLEIANSIKKTIIFLSSMSLNLLETVRQQIIELILQIAHSNDLGVLSKSLNAFYNDQFI